MTIAKERLTRELSEFDLKVGARIRRRRRELGISQKALGQQLGVSLQQVQKYENGNTRLLASRLYAISQVLGTSVPDLIGIRDQEAAAAPRSELARLTEAWNRLPPGRSRQQLLRYIETLCLEAGETEPGNPAAWTASTS
ncbi:MULTISPECIES: helix-turn-helix domain-containing protein [Brevundimonas]|uniref:Transcriptional regulator, Cro/CI family n=1 Tax=Brevundimonas abyssalis TAR-001 TaxID=1391729 RepID=A0A8E0KHJ1_9CAUL|nr:MULTISPECIES: helix-turn-helix transcriptional regulator [Brevundimonas]GAD58283.1 transcriptional regulator, Cro/CI family [Brevundimonas abyssalis TAR-001]